MKNFLFLVITGCLLIAGNAAAQSWKIYEDSAAVYMKQGDAAGAIPFYEKAAQAIRKDSAGTNSFIRVLYALAELYSGTDQYDKAEPLYREVLSVTEKLHGKADRYARICKSLGTLYFYTSNYEKADSFFLAALHIREKIFGKEHALYAESCNTLGVLNGERGDYEQAEWFHSEALRIRKKVIGPESREFAQSCENLAIIYVSTGQNKKAEELFTEACDIYRKVVGDEHPAYLSCFNNLASLYYEMRQFDKAEPYLLQVLAAREKIIGREHPDYAISCNNLANLYGDIGQYEKALQLLTESRDIWANTTGKENPYYASACINLAVACKKMQQTDRAETLYTEARDLFEKLFGKNHTNYAKCLGNLASLYADTRREEKAASLYTEARTIWEKVLGKDHPDYAESCMALAALYSDMGLYEKAEPLFLEAGQIWKASLGTEHNDYKNNALHLANLYRNTRDKRAFQYFREAFHSERGIRKRIFSFASESEKLFYLNSKKNYNQDYLSFVTELPGLSDPAFSYEVSLEGRNMILSSLQQLRQSVLQATDTSLGSKYHAWIEAKEQAAFWLAKPVNERNRRDSVYQEKANALEKELVRLSNEFRTYQNVIDWKGVQASLNIGEAAVEFMEFQYYDGKRLTDSNYYIALVLTKEKTAPSFTRLFEKRQLDSLLKYKSTSAGRIALNQLYTSGREEVNPLYRLVWKPIESQLSGVHTVFLAPAGSLFKIAFAGLPVNNREVLSDRYKLIQLNTTASVADKTTTIISAEDKVMLYGGVQYDMDSASMKSAAMGFAANDIAGRALPKDLTRDGVPEFRYLSGTSKEVSGIHKLAVQGKHTITLLEGKRATEESFKALNGGQSPEVLHIATHGFFFPDPKQEARNEKEGGYEVFRQSDNPLIRSGLALAGANNAWKGKPVSGVEDGILTSYEVSNMYLPNTKLAVLSACETGLGDIQGSEGVYGLQRAFKMAGADNLLMSLWKVPDAETSEFMQELYKHLFAKLPVQDAFQQAQTTMKNKYRNDPFKWAAWVLIR